tara:strand:+ start:1487 stop:1726 length:240 start_codon:yes stop_codon:yes gene_type:complete
MALRFKAQLLENFAATICEALFLSGDFYLGLACCTGFEIRDPSICRFRLQLDDANIENDDRAIAAVVRELRLLDLCSAG